MQVANTLASSLCLLIKRGCKKLQIKVNSTSCMSCLHASIRMSHARCWMMMMQQTHHYSHEKISLCGNIFEFPKTFVIQISIESLTPINFVPRASSIIHHPSSTITTFTILLRDLLLSYFLFTKIVIENHFSSIFDLD